MGARNNSRQFCNKECEYFPCHKGVDEENFSCMFCYCPLYPLGKKCGGEFTYSSKGIKDCSNCTMPHDPANYDKMIDGCGKVCKQFASQRKKTVRRVIFCLLIALLLCAACLVLPAVGIRNMWQIPETLDMPEIAQVLAQLKDGTITPAYIPAAVCALLTFCIGMRLHRHKITAFVLIVPVFIVCVLTALVFTVVNGVPMYTILGILLEYLRLGAF